MVPPVISLILWAVFALPLWHILAAAPAGAVSKSAQGPVLALGFVVATALAYQIDRRVVRIGGWRQWRIPRAWMAGAAFVAGCGAAILGSEVGNIVLSLSPALREPMASRLEVSPWVGALLWGLVHPVCLTLMVNDVVHRTFRVVHKPRTAMLFTVFLGALTGGLAFFPQWVAVLTLPAWLYRHSQAPLLSVVGFLPVGLSAALGSLGLDLGIDGFDVVAPDKVLWQPVWFDLLGAALVAAGVAPFLRAWAPIDVEP